MCTSAMVEMSSEVLASKVESKKRLIRKTDLTLRSEYQT